MGVPQTRWGIRPKSLPCGYYVPIRPRKDSKGTALTALSQLGSAETVLSEVPVQHGSSGELHTAIWLTSHADRHCHQVTRALLSPHPQLPHSPDLQPLLQDLQGELPVWFLSLCTVILRVKPSLGTLMACIHILYLPSTDPEW